MVLTYDDTMTVCWKIALLRRSIRKWIASFDLWLFVQEIAILIIKQYPIEINKSLNSESLPPEIHQSVHDSDNNNGNTNITMTSQPLTQSTRKAAIRTIQPNELKSWAFPHRMSRTTKTVRILVIKLM